MQTDREHRLEEQPGSTVALFHWGIFGGWHLSFSDCVQDEWRLKEICIVFQSLTEKEKLLKVKEFLIVDVLYRKDKHLDLDLVKG